MEEDEEEEYTPHRFDSNIQLHPSASRSNASRIRVVGPVPSQFAPPWVRQDSSVPLRSSRIVTFVEGTLSTRLY